LYYKSEFQSECYVSFPVAHTKFTLHVTLITISRQIRVHTTFWKVLRQINPYLLNKWPLKFACAYLNTQRSCTTGTPLIRTQGGSILVWEEVSPL
ncbi:hypothetical protein T12_1416, partial [Trichinella patagoniensis]